MSIHIDECDSKNRALALQQIGETEGTRIVSPAVQKSIDVAQASQEAFDTSMAYAKSIKTANQPNISLPKLVPSLVAALVPVANLKAHQLSVRVYGEPTASEDLLRSIREIGVIQPIVIDEDNFILAGTSRHFAAVQAGQAEIPAVLFQGSNIEREWFVLESNRQRVKLASQIVREYIERLRLESEFAKLRMVEGGKNKGTPQLEEAGEARDKAAKAVNLGRTTAERLAKVVSKADSGQPKARKILASVDAGELSITAAFHELEPQKAKPADCPVCHEPFPSLTTLKKHARHVHGLEGGSLYTALGINHVERDPRYNQVSPYADNSAMDESHAYEQTENQAARLKQLVSEIEAPVPPNKTHLKLLATVLELLQEADATLSKVKNVESIEEYKALVLIDEARRKLSVTEDTITKTTKNLNRHIAQLQSRGVTDSDCHFSGYADRGGGPYKGCDDRECLRHFKRFVAQKGWICTGGHQFVRVKDGQEMEEQS
jgi:hypothetical protein